MVDKIRVAMMHSDAVTALRLIRHEFEVKGIPDLEVCTGNAHSDPHIDNCGACAPRWGWTGERVDIT